VSEDTEAKEAAEEAEAEQGADEVDEDPYEEEEEDIQYRIYFKDKEIEHATMLQN
jgi:hypothetical protein